LLAAAELLSECDRTLEPHLYNRAFNILCEISERELRDDNEVLHGEGFLRLLAYFVRNWPEKSGVRDLVRVKMTISMEIEDRVVTESVRNVMEAMTPAIASSPLIEQWCSRVMANRKQFAMAIGLLKDPGSDVLDSITGALTSRAVDVAVKAELISSLCNIVEKRPPEDDTVVALIVQGLDDYTVDARGDIGSSMRERAITACERLYSSLPEPLQRHALRSLVRISVEVLPRLRVMSHRALHKVGHITGLTVALQNFSDALLAARSVSDAEHSATTTEYFSRMLDIFSTDVETQLRQELIKGLVTSVGAVQAGEGTLQAAYNGLIDYLRRNPGRKMKLYEDVLYLVDVKAHGARTTLCALRTLAKVFQSGLEIPHSQVFLQMAYVRIYNAHINTKATPRIISAVQLFAGLGSAGHEKSLRHLAALCKHRFPCIRDEAARALYETISSCDDLDDNSLTALDILEGTDW
jgi:hypothetical protein